MHHTLPFAVGFFSGTLMGVLAMALVAAGELRRKPVTVAADRRK